MASTDPLLAYKKKRDFALTSELAGAVARKKSVLSFVIQKHAARSLHYDFRLELDGTLKSWAICQCACAACRRNARLDRSRTL